MKNIASKNDLALFGAAPAFDAPVHVGRPNIGSQAQFNHLVGDMFERRWLGNNGPLLLEFERRVAEFLGVKHCVAMCNGTIALEIATRALGLKGEVIIPSYTFVATAHALSWQGITPVFADVNEHDHCIDVSSVERMITPNTTGIIGVHLWGNGADVEALEQLAKKHQLTLMFDAAHAFGCSHFGQRIGGFGKAEVFSFHATKFFNTFEGGAVTTNDDLLAEKMRLMRNFGFHGFDNVIHPGTNGKMIEICAAMGIVNLEYLPQVVAANRHNYQQYTEAFAGLDGVSLLQFRDAENCNFQYVVLELAEHRQGQRDQIVAALHAENILARKYFWPGCHAMPYYKALFPHASLVLPNTVRVADRVIVLPTGTTLPKDTPNIIARVISALWQ